MNLNSLESYLEIPGIQLENGGAVFSAATPPTSTIAPDGTEYPQGSLCILTTGGVYQLQATGWVDLETKSGEAIIDFGAFPGTSETSVFVSTTRPPSGTVVACFMADTTTDHSASDHRYAGLFIHLSTSLADDGSGFTIYATSTQSMSGTFKVRWKY